MSPMGHVLYAKVRTARGRYIYDTYSNEIFSVSEEVWNAADSLLVDPALCRDASMPPILSDDVSGSPAAEVAAARATGHFLPTRIESMAFGTDEDLLHYVDTHLCQLALEVTDGCNLRCHYCSRSYVGHESDEARQMHPSTMRRAVDWFLGHSEHAGSRAVSFWGGEPLQAFPLLVTTFEYCRSVCRGVPFRFSFTTNACLLTPSRVDALVGHDVQLMVSLDGPRVVHDRHRVDSRGGSFDHVMANLREVKARHPDYYASKVSFNCVLTPDADIDDIIEFYTTNALVTGHSVHVTLVSSHRNRFYEVYGGYRPGQVEHFHAALRKGLIDANGPDSHILTPAALQRLGVIARRDRRPIPTQIHLNGCCIPLTKKMHVAVDGSIHLCERVGPGMPLGNVNDAGVDEEALLALVHGYAERRLSECRQCWAVRICGACYRDFESSIGGPAEDEVGFCAGRRRAVLRQLEDYIAVLEERPGAFSDGRVAWG